ncbi:MAG: hypothetical protein GVY09_12930 [Gammaproteobacteria bacterium]|nr:hypothetical protein [Gammaproteobacteria bacterium]
MAVAMDQLRMGEHKVVLPHDIGSKVLVEGLPGWKSAEFEALADSDQVQIERADLAAFESEPRSRGQASGER